MGTGGHSHFWPLKVKTFVVPIADHRWLCPYLDSEKSKQKFALLKEVGKENISLKIGRKKLRENNSVVLASLGKMRESCRENNSVGTS